MTDPADADGRDGWTLAVYLARVAWADEPYDSFSGVLAALAPAHLLAVTGDPVPAAAGLDPASGPAAVLPELVRTLRGVREPGPACLALVTATAGDVSSVPPVPSLRAGLGGDGHALLVRDDRTGSAVALAPRRVADDVLRWSVLGVAACPEPVSPPGVAEAGARLSAAVVAAAERIDDATARSGGAGGAVRPRLDPVMSLLPAGLPGRVTALVDRIDAVEAVSASALARPSAGNAGAEREPVLRALRAALDEARRAVVAAVAVELATGRRVQS